MSKKNLPAPQAKPRAASQRHSDIRNEIKYRLDRLFDLYEQTDPAKGAESEEDKLENARNAIEQWWYVYADLLLWAQSQITGYEFLKANPAFVDRLNEVLGGEITPDSHALEYIGLMYSWNNVNYEDPMRDLIEAELEKFDGGLSDPALRSIVRELLVARSANSSFWRFPIQEGLYGLNLGQVTDIFAPVPNRRQGDAIQLARLKALALMHVHFRMGKGTKKYRALEIVAEELGQSVETLRSWEKVAVTNDDFEVWINASAIAGELESELDTKPIKELEELYFTNSFRNLTDIYWAHVALREIRATPLAELKDSLRSARVAKSGS